MAGTRDFEDWMTNPALPLAPLATTRGRAYERAVKLYKPDLLIGHSKSGPMAGVLGNRYGIPVISINPPFRAAHEHVYRHGGDIVSNLMSYVQPNETEGFYFNPFYAHSYKYFTGPLTGSR